jgi:hypothetical protein
MVEVVNRSFEGMCSKRVGEAHSSVTKYRYILLLPLQVFRQKKGGLKKIQIHVGDKSPIPPLYETLTSRYIQDVLNGKW